MTIDFQQLGDEKTGLTQWSDRLLCIPSFWAKDSNCVVDGPHGELDIIANAQLGMDHAQHEFDAGGAAGEEMQVSQVGNRLLTLNVQVQTWDQSLACSARFYLERFRTRVRWPSSLAELRVFGLAVVRVGNLLLLDPPKDDHAYSRASLDVFFSGHVLEEDAPTTYIQSADIRSNQLTDVDGSPTETQIDTTVTIP